jgi:aldehyde dehydrogenase (NAD+)
MKKEKGRNAMTILPDEAYTKVRESHRAYFNSGVTKPVEFRIRQLAALKKAMKNREKELLDALWLDLHKSAYEAYTTELGILYSSIDHTIKNLRKWVKPEKAGAPLMLFGTRNRVYREPYGTVLIIGPFNYPVNLIIEPLIGAVAAGNCAVISTSRYTPYVSGILAQLIRDTFDEWYISIFEGGREVTTCLLSQPFDYVFFTGSEQTGRAVMRAAAEHLVPVTLELGGKSPCIVDDTADMITSARKICWGKFSNAGQTCVAPDYLVVHRHVREKLIREIQKHIREFYGDNPKESSDFGRIISTAHTERLGAIIGKSRVISGGEIDIERKYIAPTLLDSDWDDESMKEELFGPVLPVIEYTDIEDVIEKIRSRPKPLALYILTKNKRMGRVITERLSFGGGCINDVMMHVGNPHLPFGGVGASGIGSYHGKQSYLTFSHEKSILERVVNIESDVMYPPYTGKKLSMIKKFLK